MEIKEEEAQHERLQAETRKKAKRPACQRKPRQKIKTSGATISKDAEPMPPTKSGRIRKPIDRSVPVSKKNHMRIFSYFHFFDLTFPSSNKPENFPHCSYYHKHHIH